MFVAESEEVLIVTVPTAIVITIKVIVEIGTIRRCKSCTCCNKVPKIPDQWAQGLWVNCYIGVFVLTVAKEIQFAVGQSVPPVKVRALTQP